MLSRDKLIDDFKRVMGAENILTDDEDIYVYSFERFFQKRRFTNIAAVVRVATNEELKKAVDLLQNTDINCIRRSLIKTQHKEKDKTIVLIDDAIQPELKIRDKQKTKEHPFESGKELEEVDPGSFLNFALALKSLFSRLPSSKCLDCEVCSGYCTVASSFKGIETWSSKGRLLLTRGLSNGDLQPSRKLVDALYSCSLCGLCFAQCFESTQTRKAIMNARHQLAEKRSAPELFTITAKNILELGDPSGMSPSKRVAWMEQTRQKGVFPKKADVLYWVGCIVSTRTPNAARALCNILSQANVDFTFLAEREGCCGYVLLAAGFWKQAKENAERLVERVKETEAETLVTPCAGCYYTFTKMYPEILDIELPCQVLHSAQFVENLLDDGKIVPHGLNLRVTYHDPCSLGRHCNVYEAPRNVLQAVPNLDLVEMPLNRNLARCCGAGGGLWSFNNQVAMNCAFEKLARDITPLGVSALVTACPTCNINFRYVSNKKAMATKVYDLTEIIESATFRVPEEWPTIFS